MSRRITVTARARADLAQAKLWYAQIRPELADAFFEDIDETFSTIREGPESFPEMETGVRRALCKAFPYKVYFVVKSGDEARVLAVYHVSRNPISWRDRR